MGSALTIWKKPESVYVTRGDEPKDGQVVCRAPMQIRGGEFVSEDTALRDLKNRIANMGANAALELSKTRYFTGESNRRHECFYFSARPALIYRPVPTNDYQDALNSKQMMDTTVKQVAMNFHAANQDMIRKEMTRSTIKTLFFSGLFGAIFYFFFLPLFTG